MDDKKKDEYLKGHSLAKATLQHFLNMKQETTFDLDDDPFPYGPSVSYGSLISLMKQFRGILALDIISGCSYIQSLASRPFSQLLSLIDGDKYEALQSKYSKNEKVVKDFMRAFKGKAVLISCCSKEAKRDGTPVLFTRYPVLIKKVYGSDKAFTDVMKKKFRDVQREFRSVQDSFDMSMSSRLEKVFKKLNEVHNGMSTPLSINFNPSGPTFPLRISSIHKGTTAIELFLCAKQQAVDKNEMLPFIDCKVISKDFRQTVSKWIEVPETAETVSRFRYEGRLSSFKKDALFIRHPNSY